MLNKSFLPECWQAGFTAIMKSTGNTGSCGRVPAAAVNRYTGTYYAYDIHGNVDTLLQDYRLGAMSNHGYNRFKEITYNYDLISGKVNEVDYQPGAVDQFYHRYEYDAENRLTDVYTTDHKAYVGHKNLEEHEAFYEYYKHGPLARSVIGQQQIQGVDYAYTLEGWLKGVNSTALKPVYDMGGDGNLVARDAYSFGLNYFTGDYASINSTVSPFPGFSGLFPSGYSYNPLYNGNISAIFINIGRHLFIHSLEVQGICLVNGRIIPGFSRRAGIIPEIFGLIYNSFWPNIFQITHFQNFYLINPQREILLTINWVKIPTIVKYLPSVEYLLSTI